MRRTYNLIARYAIESSFVMDSYNVVAEVEKYRWYWKPRNDVKVVLLAESHVRTQTNQFEHLLDRKKLVSLGLDDYPEHFVRFVYCLASGENLLLNHPISPARNNASKWQFWEILWSCIHDPSREEFPLTHGRTQVLETRLSKKVDLLRQLQNRGIWLLDASIVGIDRAKPTYKKKVLGTSWTNYVKPLILSLEPRPEHLLVIGKGVSNSVFGKSSPDSGSWEGVSYDVIDQPQSHLTISKRLGQLMKVYGACNGQCLP